MVKGYQIFLDQKIGEGSQGSVHKVSNVGLRGEKSHQGLAFCHQVFRKRQKQSWNYSVDGDSYLQNAFRSELMAMRSVSSPNVVKLITVFQSSINYYLVQELCEKSLRKEIEEAGKFSCARALRVIDDLSMGMLNLIREGIVHRQKKCNSETSGRITSSTKVESTKSVSSASQ